jgi:hypothetical protein
MLSICNISRLRLLAAVFILSVLIVPGILHAQEPAPFWRTLLIDDSTPQAGETSEVFLQFGNRSSQAVNVEHVLCITIAFNGTKTYPTDALRATQVVNGRGMAVPFSTTPYTSVEIPVNRVFSPGQQQTFRITLFAERPNYQYNSQGDITGSSAYGFGCWVYGLGNQTLASDGLQIYVAPAS